MTHVASSIPREGTRGHGKQGRYVDQQAAAILMMDTR